MSECVHEWDRTNLLCTKCRTSLVDDFRCGKYFFDSVEEAQDESVESFWQPYRLVSHIDIGAAVVVGPAPPKLLLPPETLRQLAELDELADKIAVNRMLDGYPPGFRIEAKKCGCGASSCGSPKHSDYCDLYKAD